MARACTVCIHDDRDEIDQAIVQGRLSIRGVAKQWGISPSAVARHRSDHVDGALVPIVMSEDAAGVATLERIEGLVFEAQRVLRNAQAEDQSKDALAAIKELRGLVELIAKLKGELQSGPQVAVVNVAASAEWQAIQSAMMEALSAFPEARQAVASRLLMLHAGGSS